MEAKDWMLLFIANAGERGLSPVQLQKGLFLLQKARPRAVGENFYDFQPYNYGPFDRDIYVHADELVGGGYVEAKIKEGQRWPEYVITEKGKNYAHSLEKETQPETIRIIKDKISWMRGFDFAGLVSAIYELYPEYRENSVFGEAS